MSHLDTSYSSSQTQTKIVCPGHPDDQRNNVEVLGGGLLRLYDTHFVSLLRYSLPVLHGLCRSSLPESIKTQAFRACPKCVSNVATIYVVRAFTAILRTQETLRVDLKVSSI